MVWIVLLLSVLVVAVPVIAWTVEPSFFSWTYWQEGGINTSRSEVFRNLGLFAAAVIGLIVGGWRARTSHRQADTSERGLVNDRFTKAAKLLKSKILPIRVGGIHAMWSLTGESSKLDVTSAIDTLCAFVCHPPYESTGYTFVPYPWDEFASLLMPHKWKWQETDEGDKTPFIEVKRVRADVLAAMKLIGSKNAEHRRDFARAHLVLANLNNLFFVDDDFLQANLWKAGLKNTDLTKANLTLANLGGADLRETNFTNANLSFANLMGVTPTENVDLKDAILTGTDLTGADLNCAKNLTQKQLDLTRYNPAMPPKVPEGLYPPEPRPEWNWLLLPPFREN